MGKTDFISCGQECAIVSSAKKLQKTSAPCFNGRYYNGNQLTFINQIIDYLTQKGILEPSQLFEITFDEIHSEGISGVFDENITDEIIDIIEGINLNADVAV